MDDSHPTASDMSTADALPERLHGGRPEFGSALDGLRARMLAVAAGGAGPHTIGRYRLGRVIGSGAFGTVYEAEDPELDRRVAVKLLSVRSAKEAARVVREARLLATLSHPNVVQVFEVGTTADGRSPYVVMELVEGPTLRTWLSEGPRSWHAVIEVMLDVARGLWAAHQAGVLHRDLKPENVLMGRDGRPRVIDFGLARAMSDEEAGSEGSTLRSGANALAAGSASGGAQLTVTGQVMGTPAYMAPEAFAGEHGPRADQYALCVTLYEALFGSRPFKAASPAELVKLMLAHEVELPADRRGVPRRVGAIALRGLRISPRERFADLGELVAALEGVLRPRRWPAVVAGLAVLGVSGLVIAGMGAEPPPAPPEVCAVGDAAWARLRAQGAVPVELEAVLASYRRTWMETEQALCSSGEGAIDWERRRCLDRGLRDAEALISTLAEPGIDAMDPDKVLRGLPSPTDCADAVRDELAPPPASLELGPLDERLSQLEALVATAQIKPSLELSGPLLEDARGAGYAPLLVEVTYLRARTLLLASDYEGARTMFEEAFFLAQREGMPRFAARAADELMYVTGYTLRDVPTARRWAAHAENAYRRAGVDPYARGSFLKKLGSLAEQEGDYAEAERLMRLAVEADLAGGYGKDSGYGGIVNHLGIVLFKAQKYHEAISAMREAVAIYQEHDGPVAPSFASGLDNIGGALMSLGHYRAAHDHHRAALEIREATLASDHMDLASSYGNMGLALMQLGRYDEALTYIDRALGVFTMRFGSEHVSVAMGLRIRGRIHVRRGEPNLAVRDFQRAAKLFAMSGPAHFDDVTQMNQEAQAVMDPALARTTP